MVQALFSELLARREAAGLLRLGTWACIGLLGLLSLLPGPEIDLLRTGADGRLEHVIAYALTMLVAGLGYRRRTPFSRIGLLLALYAAALELAQLYVPGRTASFADLGAGVLGVVLAGVALRTCLARLCPARGTG